MTMASNDIDVNKLLDKPYSELTEEEINEVIEFKAGIIARDQAHTERLKAIQDTGNKLVEQQEAQAQEARDNQNTLLQASLARLAKLNGTGD